MNCQLRKSKSETFDIGKLFLDRTSPLKTLEPREHVRTCESSITNVRNYLKLDHETQTTFLLRYESKYVHN